MDENAGRELVHALHDGMTREDRRGAPVLYRFLRPGDDIVAMTELLHRAYAPLAAAGLHYVASHQPPEVTRRRMNKGDTLVALVEERIIGVITLADASATTGSPFYDQPGVAGFGQFAVEPACQKAGVGSVLLAMVEALARTRGVRELALDTSEHATGLIQFYTSKGYRFVEFARWPSVNYRSVVMAKALERPRGRP